MGILKSREELLPVTCAVLKEEEREHFFAAARKKVGGNMDRIAKLANVPVGTVADWANGKADIPYHTLQRLAQELAIEAPAVSELRREYQLVIQTPAPRMRPEAPPPRPVAREPRPPRAAKKVRGKREPQAPRAQAKPERAPRPRREKKERPQHKPQSQAQPQAGSRSPKPSDKLAYWSAVLFTIGKYQDKTVVLAADRRIGQNFAATWANLTSELLRVKPTLRMSEDRKVQEALLPTEGLEEFLAGMEFKPETPADALPGAPRWAWSNPSWKAAFLRGVVDASAHFHRTPSLNLLGLSQRLSQSVQKIFASLGFEPKAGTEQSLVLEGKEAVEKYFSSVDTWNMKLRDQFKAYHRPSGETPAEEAPATETPATGTPAAGRPAAKHSRRTRYRGRPGSR